MYFDIFRTIALAGALLCAPPALAQSSAALDVVEAMGFMDDYESHADWVVEAMAEYGLVGTPQSTAKDVTKLQNAMRRDLIEDKFWVATMLALGLEERRSTAELQALRMALDAGMSIENLPGQVGYAMSQEIYRAMSGSVLVTAMGSQGR